MRYWLMSGGREHGSEKQGEVNKLVKAGLG